MPNTKGHDPSTELETRGGIWRYDANKTGQKLSTADRYATGIRNGEGMDFDGAGDRTGRGGAMPPRGGAPLSDSDVNAVGAFVWGISH